MKGDVDKKEKKNEVVWKYPQLNFITMKKKKVGERENNRGKGPWKTPRIL